MRKALVLIALLAGAGVSETADAGIPFTRRMTCPIGGQEFDYTTTASYSTFGSRPDGKPYGSWIFPLALPECPGNGLILYEETFAPETLGRLGQLIARAEYQPLRRAETQYYRLAWLLREMDEPVERQLWTLTQATWEADQVPVQRTRYLAELAQRIEAAGLDLGTNERIAYRALWINALRELGRFEEATALLARTTVPPSAAGTEEEDREERQGWTVRLAMLRRLVERKDASIEPLDAVPDHVGAHQCVERSNTLSDWERAWCAEHRALVDQARESVDG